MSDGYQELAGPVVRALECERCGALVTDVDAHNTFHETLVSVDPDGIIRALDRIR